MQFTLHVWRQRNAAEPGRMVQYAAKDVEPDMSFLEMLDVVNKDLCEKGEEPIAFDRIIQRGGFVSVNTGGAQDANNIPVPKPNAELAMDAAACIGCGACVAACKNASAMLFVASKVSHLSLLPQGAPERKTRVLRMVEQMDKEGFGSCTNYFECEAACPKQISVGFIARMNREYLKANLTERE